MLHLRLYPSRVFITLLALFAAPLAVNAQLVTAPGAGVSPLVRVIDTNGTERTFFAYHQAFTGGVRIALGDVTGDGVLDIVTAPGPGGGPHVRVWNGVDLTEIGGFFAYDPAFPGGVFVAAGDVDGDGRADIITGAGAGGGPHVRIWSGADFHELGGFFAYHPAFPGGVTVAAGDVNGDGRADIITGPGPGGGPHVRIWSGADLNEIFGFFAYDPGFPGGVTVAAGDVNGDGRADVITGAGPGGGPHVRVWNINGFAELGGFFGYDPAFTGGINVAALDLTGDGRTEIITGVGPGGLPISSIWSGADLSLMGRYFAFDPSVRAGVFVASVGKSSPLRFTSATSTAFSRGIAGTFTVITAGGASAPALTVTGALPSGVTFVDNGNRTATLSGTPTVSGTFPLTFSADNGSSAPITQSFTLTVSAAPAITSPSSVTFSVGSVASIFTVTTTGSPTPDLAASGALPSGVTFTDNDNGTATLAGTPAPGSSGTYPLVITASNSSGAAVQNFTLTINTAAAITSVNATTFTAGSAGSFTVTTTGSPTATTINVSGSLPTGVTFVNNGNGTATLSGTPGAASGGTYPLTITATNGVGAPASQSFTLTVNRTAAITSGNATTFLIGSIGTFTVTTTGFPTPVLSTASTLPAGVTFTDNGDGTATIAGTPGAGTGGTYPLTIAASNGVGAPASQGFTLSVQQAASITSAAAATFVTGSPGTFTVTTAGFPVPALTTSGALPTGVTFADNGNGTATLAGTPAAGTGGTYPLTITAGNGVGAPAAQSFTLTVNQAPAITSANTVTFAIGQAGSFTVTSTGFPVPGLVAGGATLPGGVTFVDNSNGTGTLSGTPAAGTVGSYALTFTASNVVGTSPVHSFTLTVACPAIAVTPAAGALAAGTFGQPYSQTLGATGSSGVTFAITGGALPPGVSLATSGLLSGSPSNTGTFNFTVTATDAFSCTGSSAYSIAVSPNAVDESYNGGVGNTQLVVSLAPFSPTPAVIIVGTVLGNDAGPGPFNAGPAGIPTANGGTVAMSAGGAFVYTPAIGFAGPSDTFVYTLTDANGITDTATVTVNLSGRVWYVNNSGANGDGRSHSPFNALSNAQAPSGAGDVIFVHEGIGTTPGAITLKTNQTLWGNAHAFALNSLSISPAGTPVLGGSVTLANGVRVRAVNISSGAAAAIVGTGLTGSETIEFVNIVGGATGYNLTNVDGTVNIINGSISGVGGTDVRIIGGNGTIAIGSPITNTSGRSVDIENRTGGSVGFTAPISDTDLGILLNNNGGTVLFLGGLTLNTGPNAAFTATNGVGRVSAQQDNVSIVNTITTTTGTALNVTNYGIGSVGLTFRSISASGAASGIVLNNTGSSGGRVVITGNGGTCSSAATCTGGAIQNTTDAGVRLTDTRNVSLTRMYIGHTGSHGVSGTGMTDITGGAQPTFEFASGLLDSPGDGDNESALFFDTLATTNITGRLVVSNSTIQNFEDVGIHVGNSSGTLTIDVTNVLINDNSDTNGEEGIDVAADGTANITLNVTGTRTGHASTTMFTDLEGGAINAIVQDSGILDVNVSGIVDRGTGGPDSFPTPPALTFSAEGSASTLTFDITDNAIIDASGDGIFIGHEGTIEGRITNNLISGLATGDGIRIDTDTASSTTSTILIQGNAIGSDATFPGIGDDGIQVLHRDGTKTLNLTVDGNTIVNTGSEGIRYFADDDGGGGGPENAVRISGNTFGNNGTADTSDSIVMIAQDPGTNVCTSITGNASVEGITLQQSLSAVLQISHASLVALAADNGGAVVTPSGVVTFNGGCSNPPTPNNP